jgi:transposase
MWIPTPGVKVYLGLGSTDMRKSIDSLGILVAEHLKQNVLSGHLFVFCNSSRTIMKILYWDRNGFCLWHKRLERDKFHWPESEKEVEEINVQQMRRLLGSCAAQAIHCGAEWPPVQKKDWALFI